ncbi:MAG TPA: acetate--CoA ligase [Chloroflexota bacterium]|nr:acetate--CoA ligase [Chloroflexota bacterium]
MDSGITTTPADAIVWRPSDAYIAGSRLSRFMRRHDIASYAELIERAKQTEWFWDAVVKDLELEWYTPYSTVLDRSRGLPWARWFVDGRFNYVYNALDKHAATHRRHQLALIWEGEDGAVAKLTYRELLIETNRLANALRALGIGSGDRVGIFMPMIPETVIAVLACGKIGAIYTPIFSGYGAASVASRLHDCGARALITADGFYRRGKVVEMKATADAAVAQAPSVEHQIVVRRTGAAVPWHEGRDRWWHDLIAGRSRAYETERTSAEDPYMIIYTSGTTGRPKGTLHVHGGFPIKGAQDMAHCFDLQDGDVLFWFTDLGWMMGPWAISGALLLGATLCIYEGTPDYPGPDRLWSLVERHGISVLGISPTAIRSLIAHGTDPVRAHDLSSLRVLGSTGETWDPDSWQWYFTQVGGTRCPIINYSGGTEIAGGILGCTVITPLKPCSFAGPIPGMDADVVDDSGAPVRGAVGELVIRNAWPGMTRGFWQDPERYLDTYWSRLPNLWVHGDWAEIDADGFWYIRGRSDDTIKVAGKRLGPAEVEAAALAHPAVAQAAAIGVPHPVKGEAVVCFVVLRPGEAESETVRAAIMDTVTAQLGKALRPEAVRFVRDLPRTRNAKTMRRVIRARYLGRQALGDLTALENPDAVEEIARAR